MHGQKLRWMTEREKLAVSGLAVSKLQAEMAGIKCPVDWQLDVGWHARVGNANQVQNVGLVLMSALAGLEIRSSAPTDLLHIQAPSFPDGLSTQNGVYMLKVGQTEFHVGPDKEVACSLHHQLHAPWLFVEFRRCKQIGNCVSCHRVAGSHLYMMVGRNLLILHFVCQNCRGPGIKSSSRKQTKLAFVGSFPLDLLFPVIYGFFAFLTYATSSHTAICLLQPCDESDAGHAGDADDVVAKHSFIIFAHKLQ